MDRRKRVVSLPERKAENVLGPVAARYGARVWPKVRVADALTIDGSGIDCDLYSYALSAHFDLLIVDGNAMPERPILTPPTTASVVDSPGSK